MTIESNSIDGMTPEQEQVFWVHLAADLGRDDGRAARAHLDAGNPVYCRTPATPKDLVEKHYPDGRRELVRFDLKGEHLVREMGTQ